MKACDPTKTLPTGAPNPLDKQTEIDVKNYSIDDSSKTNHEKSKDN